MTIQNFSMKAGNTKPFLLTIEDVTNLSDADIEFLIIKDGAVYLQRSDFTITGNTLSFTLQPSETQGFNGLYNYELNLTDAYGNVTSPITGTVNFTTGGNITAEQVFVMSMKLMGEETQDGTFNGYSDDLKKSAWPILTILQSELTPASQFPSIVNDETSFFYIDDRTALTTLPYGLAAHLLMEENQTKASFFNARYDELKMRRPATISKIKDVYFSGEDATVTPITLSGTSSNADVVISNYDGGEF